MLIQRTNCLNNPKESRISHNPGCAGWGETRPWMQTHGAVSTRLLVCRLKFRVQAFVHNPGEKYEFSRASNNENVVVVIVAVSPTIIWKGYYASAQRCCVKTTKRLDEKCSAERNYNRMTGDRIQNDYLTWRQKTICRNSFDEVKISAGPTMDARLGHSVLHASQWCNSHSDVCSTLKWRWSRLESPFLQNPSCKSSTQKLTTPFGHLRAVLHSWDKGLAPLPTSASGHSLPSPSTISIKVDDWWVNVHRVTSWLIWVFSLRPKTQPPLTESWCQHFCSDPQLAVIVGPSRLTHCSSSQSQSSTFPSDPLPSPWPRCGSGSRRWTN